MPNSTSLQTEVWAVAADPEEGPGDRLDDVGRKAAR